MALAASPLWPLAVHFAAASESGAARSLALPVPLPASGSLPLGALPVVYESDTPTHCQRYCQWHTAVRRVGESDEGGPTRNLPVSVSRRASTSPTVRRPSLSPLAAGRHDSDVAWRRASPNLAHAAHSGWHRAAPAARRGLAAQHCQCQCNTRSHWHCQ